MRSDDASPGAILRAQHADGGWGFASGTSWAEPTCYAIMALRAARAGSAEVARACDWLAGLQTPGGGIVPARGVEQPTAVTSLAILALSGKREYESAAAAAANWLVELTGAETTGWLKFIRRLAGRSSPATEYRAWPWYPGTAAWVVPTSLTLLALQRRAKLTNQSALAERIYEGREFLMVRRCPDHCWNHGGTARANELPFSYPETTGIALLALHGSKDPALQQSLDPAQELYRTAPSAEGQNWLLLGLRAHGRQLAPPRPLRHWTVNSAALSLIANCAESGPNPFLEDVPE